jgi:hypothetical protein
MSDIDVSLLRHFFGGKPLIDNCDYQGGQTVIYQGFAATGTAQTEPGWIIWQYFYDNQQKYMGSLFSGGYVAWANRAAVNYA